MHLAVVEVWLAVVDEIFLKAGLESGIIDYYCHFGDVLLHSLCRNIDCCQLSFLRQLNFPEWEN